MRDILAEVERWRAAGEPVALATVVQAWGSAPRAAGAKMAVSGGGEIAGSVSGGCVENAVIEAAAAVLAAGSPRLLHFGVSDETAWSVGLACGGTIDVFVETLRPDSWEPFLAAVAARRPAAVATAIGGPDALIGAKVLLLGDGAASGSLGEGVAASTREALAEGASRRISVGDADVFIEVVLPPPTLIVVGGVHIAVALISMARTLGYRTVLVDPRESFANARRFPHVDRIVSAWPDAALQEIGLDASTAVAVLTHDPKLDDPALLTALRSPAFYVGALGSSRTQEKRRGRLLGAGLPEGALARLYAPIGLNLGGRGPEEIALSVMAQIVASRNRRG